MKIQNDGEKYQHRTIFIPDCLAINIIDETEDEIFI